MNCFTKKHYKKYKSRNLTKRSYQHFKEHLTTYLSPQEQNKLKCKLNIPIIKNYNHNKTLLRQIKSYLYTPKNVSQITQSLYHYDMDKKHILMKNEYESFYKIHHKNKPYETYYYEKDNKTSVILDLNDFRSSYLKIGHIELNFERKIVLFNIDFIGNRIFHFFVKPFFVNDIQELKLYNDKTHLLLTHETLGLHIKQEDSFKWLDANSFVYYLYDKSYNSSKTYIYNIETKQSYLLYKSKHTFINVDETSDHHYFLLYDSDYNSDEIYLIDYTTKYKVERCLFKRRFSVLYPFIDHYNSLWYIHKQNKEKDIIMTTYDFKHFDILYENNELCEQIQEVKLHKHVVYFIIHTPRKNKVCSLENKRLKTYDIHDEQRRYFFDFGVFRCNTYELHYSSYLSHRKTLNLCDSLCISKDKTNYIEKNIFIHPMLYFTLMYKKNNSPKDSKCLMFGYGSYRDSGYYDYFHYFKYLLEKDYIIVYAHIRGGGEFGYKGYDEGRLLKKKNTFYDFIDIAHYLFEHKYTSRDKLVIWGRSAGGLLISSVLNIEPDICNLAILGVPFITPILTMKSKHNPLGYESHSEFGNPHLTTHLSYIKSYAPLHNIKKNGSYPHIFIYSNLNDTLVPYKESILYYEQMKEVDVFKNKKRDLQLFIDPLFGHNQGSSKKDKLTSYARIIDMILQKN